MAKIKQTLKCGCVVAIDYNNMVQVDYCPKHKAAPMMYEALKEYQYYNRCHNDSEAKLFDLAMKALAKADGQ